MAAGSPGTPGVAFLDVGVVLLDIEAEILDLVAAPLDSEAEILDLVVVPLDYLMCLNYFLPFILSLTLSCDTKPQE